MSFQVIQAIVESADEVALVTVVDVEGSAPRHPGSAMVVRRTAAGGAAVWKGTVGGGKGEARAIALAGECMDTRSCRMLTLEFLGENIEGQDMICGGTARLLVEPIKDRTPYRMALERLGKGERTLLVKTIGADVRTALLDENGAVLFGDVPPFVREPAARALATGAAALLGDRDVFLDPVFPDDKLLVLGGGYVGQAVAWHAVRLGFTVTVADDRPQFSGEGSAGRFPPGVRTLCGPYTDTVNAFPFDAATYVVMVTRGHLTDLECVRAVLGKSWRYAGFIGSTRKARLLREQLSRDGFGQGRIQRLHSPIGLEIGAETPDELAVSILAEMITVRRNAGQRAEQHAGQGAGQAPVSFDRPTART